jgi:hypothetical protein
VVHAVYGHIDRNPMEGLKPSDALKPTRKENYARLDAREMQELLRKIEGYQRTSITRLAMKLLALIVRRDSHDRQAPIHHQGRPGDE